LRDISERKRHQNERALLASIVDTSGDAIYSLTLDLNFSSWNAAAERLFGFSTSEVIGRSALLLVPIDRRAEVIQQLNRSENPAKANISRAGGATKMDILSKLESPVRRCTARRAR
jgi:PAS domain S-box-containing protein